MFDIQKFKDDAKAWFRASIKPYLKIIKTKLDDLGDSIADNSELIKKLTDVVNKNIKSIDELEKELDAQDIKEFKYDPLSDKLIISLKDGSEFSVSGKWITEWADNFKLYESEDKKVHELQWTQHKGAISSIEKLDIEPLWNPTTGVNWRVFKDKAEAKFPHNKPTLLKLENEYEGEVAKYIDDGTWEILENGIYSFSCGVRLKGFQYKEGDWIRFSARTHKNRLVWLDYFVAKSDCTKAREVGLYGNFTQYLKKGDKIKLYVHQGNSQKADLEVLNNNYPWSQTYGILTKVA